MSNKPTHLEDETIKLLIELLNIPSITPDDKGCQERLISRLEPLGFNCERFNYNQTSNLWAKIGNQQPLICFCGHTDVVPPGNADEWITPPFQATIREGELYARGTADMKSGLAAFITALERFLKNQPNFNCSLAVLITSDEEGDNIDGTQKVVEALKARGELIDYCIVAEPTSIDCLGDTIKNGRRGTMSAKLKIKGKQGHIAYPQLAVNPVHKSINALKQLTEYQWGTGIDYFPLTSFQISNIHAGLGVGNVIPGELEVWFNFRYSPENTAEELQQKVESILKAEKLEYMIDWQISGLPFITPKGKLTETCQKVIEEELGIVSEINTLGGTSDGRFVKNIANELIELGPINATIHQVNEHVNIADVIALSAIYEKIIVSLLKE